MGIMDIFVHITVNHTAFGVTCPIWVSAHTRTHPRPAGRAIEHPPAAGVRPVPIEPAWTTQSGPFDSGRQCADRQVDNDFAWRISGQAKLLINPVSRCYPPPRTWSRHTTRTSPHHLARNHLARTHMKPTSSRCEPLPANQLLPEPSTCSA